MSLDAWPPSHLEARVASGIAPLLPGCIEVRPLMERRRSWPGERAR
jgi:hypothetical protein